MAQAVRSGDRLAVAAAVTVVLWASAFVFIRTWAYALARTTAGRMGVTTYAGLGAGLADGLDRAGPGAADGGGLLCLSGVAITRSGARAPEKVGDSTDTDTRLSDAPPRS